MSPQLSLLDPTSEHTSNLFFALFPDAETAARLSALAQELRTQYGLKGKPLDAERFHVSLCQVGTYDGSLPESILSQARRAAASLVLPPFAVAFDHVRSFPSDHSKPLVLVANEGNTALKTLQHKLGQALTRAGLGRWVAKAYTPHLTLLYDRREIATEHIVKVRWTAQEFVLVRSFVGEGRYERLDVWPFQTQE